MIFTGKLFTTSMIAAAGAIGTALTFSPTAAADPAPAPAPAPAAPDLSTLPFLNQLAAVPAVAPQILQGLQSTLTGVGTPAAAPAVAPAPAAAPAPTASAAVTLPGAVAPAPTAAPANAAALPAAGATPNVAPEAQVQLPQVAGLNLPQKLAFPSDLAALMPAGTPLAGLLPKATPAAPAAAATAGSPAVASAVQPVQTAGVAQLPLPASALSALP